MIKHVLKSPWSHMTSPKHGVTVPCIKDEKLSSIIAYEHYFSPANYQNKNCFKSQSYCTDEFRSEIYSFIVYFVRRSHWINMIRVYSKINFLVNKCKGVWYLTTLVKDIIILVLWYRIFRDVETEERGHYHPLVAKILPIFILRKWVFFTLID